MRPKNIHGHFNRVAERMIASMNKSSNEYHKICTHTNRELYTPSEMILSTVKCVLLCELKNVHVGKTPATPIY